jgi:hypothetical protein
MNFSKTLLERVPEELRNKACVCRACVTEFHESQNSIPALASDRL